MGTEELILCSVLQMGQGKADESGEGSGRGEPTIHVI